MTRPPPISTLFPYTTLFRSLVTHLLGKQQLLNAEELEKLVVVRAKYQGAKSVTALPLGLSETYGLRNHGDRQRSEEHTSELQSRQYLVCRLLLEKKKPIKKE